MAKKYLLLCSLVAACTLGGCSKPPLPPLTPQQETQRQQLLSAPPGSILWLKDGTIVIDCGLDSDYPTEVRLIGVKSDPTRCTDVSYARSSEQMVRDGVLQITARKTIDGEYTPEYQAAVLAYFEYAYAPADIKKTDNDPH